jgi:hypothetical protein
MNEYLHPTLLQYAGVFIYHAMYNVTPNASEFYVPGSQGDLGLFNLWTRQMLQMQNITWTVKFFLAES